MATTNTDSGFIDENGETIAENIVALNKAGYSEFCSAVDALFPDTLSDDFIKFLKVPEVQVNTTINIEGVEYYVTRNLVRDGGGSSFKGTAFITFRQVLDNDYFNSVARIELSVGGRDAKAYSIDWYGPMNLADTQLTINLQKTGYFPYPDDERYIGRLERYGSSTLDLTKES